MLVSTALPLQSSEREVVAAMVKLSAAKTTGTVLLYPLAVFPLCFKDALAHGGSRFMVSGILSRFGS
ncbi:hypothetical protein D9757_009550 [Collybiopsis confluens]|uniref:Uncharacterized protein n=1 Tax=Collybiopsis confluens TaxID=2823264 RepID=A0A8H5H8L9_9AGAR|nr:hypothetical protein D9757_009550 [Collybiopsis confluens]